MKPQDRIIVALDHENILEAAALVERLGERVNFYKIGLGSLTRGGGALGVELMEQGKRVFSDMKFFDIGATVERAARGQAELGVDFLTVHGDPHVVRAAVFGRGNTKTKILAVTILTSLDRADLDDALIVEGELHNLVRERAKRAFEAGADGVIASAEEAKIIRELREAEGKIIVTPGIRPQGAELGDQKRAVTPRMAVENGADYLVIGRPIIAASDPVKAADEIIAQIEASKN